MRVGRVNGCSPPGFSRQQPKSCLASRVTTQHYTYAPAAQKPVMHRMRGPMSSRPISLDHIGCVPVSYSQSRRPPQPVLRVVPIKPHASQVGNPFLLFSLQQALNLQELVPILRCLFFVLFLFVPYL